MSMPDPWEYPWFAAWDLGLPLRHASPTSTRSSPSTSCCCSAASGSSTRTAPCPPTSGTSATSTRRSRRGPRWRCSPSTAHRDIDFLERVFDKLLVNFTWWVNLEDADGSNLFEGGFLGLDNIGPIDRSHLPVGGRLEQSDATGWMAFYSLTMATIASILNRSGTRSADDLVLKFLEHFAAIRRALEAIGRVGRGGRVLLRPAHRARRHDLARQGPFDGRRHPAARGDLHRPGTHRSGQGARQGCRSTARPLRWHRGARRTRARARRGRQDTSAVGCHRTSSGWSGCWRDCSIQPSSSRRTACGPCRPGTATIRTNSTSTASARTIDYEPAESTTSMFGGNSNWRGPIWMPLNYLVIGAIERYGHFFGDELQIEYPTGSGVRMDLMADRRRPPATSHRAVHRRARRSAAVLRSGRSAAARSALVRQHRRSTSTSTATTALVSAPPIRPAGPASWPT